MALVLDRVSYPVSLITLDMYGCRAKSGKLHFVSYNGCSTKIMYCVTILAGKI